MNDSDKKKLIPLNDNETLILINLTWLSSTNDKISLKENLLL